jgi:hypothetical protein
MDKGRPQHACRDNHRRRSSEAGEMVVVVLTYSAHLLVVGVDPVELRRRQQLQVEHLGLQRHQRQPLKAQVLLSAESACTAKADKAYSCTLWAGCRLTRTSNRHKRAAHTAHTAHSSPVKAQQCPGTSGSYLEQEVPCNSTAGSKRAAGLMRVALASCTRCCRAQHTEVAACWWAANMHAGCATNKPRSKSR